jgi:hypothetical protein
MSLIGQILTYQRMMDLITLLENVLSKAKGPAQLSALYFIPNPNYSIIITIIKVT